MSAFIVRAAFCKLTQLTFTLIVGRFNPTSRHEFYSGTIYYIYLLTAVARILLELRHKLTYFSQVNVFSRTLPFHCNVRLLS